jgi:DNA-binding MarR family transcriptional regulator
VIADWQRVTHRLLAALDEQLADLRLTPGEVNALAALHDGPRTARALADATGQRPSTLTGVLDRLERRGLAERRPNPADRRSTLIALTERGRRDARRVAGAFAALEERIDAGAVRAELAALEAAVSAPQPTPRSHAARRR